MEQKKEIEQQISDTLQEFDASERIKPDAYYTARTMARIREESAPSGRSLFRPVMVGIVIALNVITAVMIFRDHDAVHLDREDYIEAFTQEYTLSTVDNFTSIDR